jgi:hypothetical protein
VKNPDFGSFFELVDASVIWVIPNWCMRVSPYGTGNRLAYDKDFWCFGEASAENADAIFTKRN